MVNETCFLLHLIHRWIWFVSAAAEFCLDRNQSFSKAEKQGNKSPKVGGWEIPNTNCWWLTDRKKSQNSNPLSVNFPVNMCIGKGNVLINSHLRKLFSHTSNLFGYHIPYRRMFTKTEKSTSPKYDLEQIFGGRRFLSIEAKCSGVWMASKEQVFRNWVY